MSIQSEVLFDQDGKPTYTLISQALSKGALRPLQGSEPCSDQGNATPYFSSWWNAAFPTRNPLPGEPVADEDGVGTLPFWQVFT